MRAVYATLGLLCVSVFSLPHLLVTTKIALGIFAVYWAYRSLRGSE